MPLTQKYHELNNNKKGIKAADQILAQHPKHAETMAMKGLLMHSAGKKEEGRALVKSSIPLATPNSHITFHVMGLVAKNDKDFKAASEYYMKAAKIDPDNVQILRDLSMMQAMMRQMPDFLATRKKLLRLRAADRINWYSCAAGQYFCGQFTDAINTMKNFIEAETKANRTIAPMEASHIHLFCNLCVHKGSGPDAALDDLTEREAGILDTYDVARRRVLYGCEAGRPDPAAFAAFLVLNPDDVAVHDAMREALKETPEALADRYSDLAAAHPRSQVIKAYPMLYGPEDAVPAALAAAIDRSIGKGTPSLYRDLTRLFIVRPSTRSMASTMIRDRLAGTPTMEEKIWLHAYLFFHAEADGDAPAQLRHAEAALGLARERFVEMKAYPTADATTDVLSETADVAENHLVVYELYATALKHNGRYTDAADTLDAAHTMEPGDRYLNTLAYISAARADRPDAARAILKEFIRDEPDINVIDLQNFHFKMTAARTHCRAGRALFGLRDLRDVLDMFSTIKEDEFDFHHFAVRKHALCEYVRLVEYESRVADTRYAQAAAVSFADIVRHLGTLDIDIAASEAYEVEYDAIYTRQLAADKGHNDSRERDPDPAALTFARTPRTEQLRAALGYLRAAATPTAQVQAMEALVEMELLKPMLAMKVIKRLRANADDLSSAMAEVVLERAMAVLSDLPDTLTATEVKLMQMAKMQLGKLQLETSGSVDATQLNVGDCLLVAPLAEGSRRWELLRHVASVGGARACLRGLEMVMTGGLGSRAEEYREMVRARLPGWQA